MQIPSHSEDRLAHLVESARRPPAASKTPLPFTLDGVLAAAPEDKAEAGKAFRAARQALGMTAKEIGALLRVNSRTIEKWEQGGGQVDASAWVLLQVAVRFPEIRILLEQSK